MNKKKYRYVIGIGSEFKWRKERKMNKNLLQIIDVGILIGFLVIGILISITSAPIANLPTDWDCSNTAAFYFNNEKKLGHDPTIVRGSNFTSMEGHVWVENEAGEVLCGGLGMKKKDLYARFTIIEIYKEIPNTGTPEWLAEWDYTI